MGCIISKICKKKKKTYYNTSRRYKVYSYHTYKNQIDLLDNNYTIKNNFNRIEPL